MKKTYIGWTLPPHDTAAENVVLVITDERHCRPLPLRLDIINHSPTGFSWGYGGSGPAQLALAILADAFGDDELADKLHQNFKWHVVARWPQGGMWQIDVDDVTETAQRITAALEADAAR